MSPFRLLTIVRWRTFVCCLLAAVLGFQTYWIHTLRAEEQAPQQEAAAEEKPPAEKPLEEKAPASKPAPVLKKRAPLHELPVLQPKQLGVPARLRIPNATTKTPLKKKPAKNKPAIQPAIQWSNAPFWQPRRGTLNPAATYRLESMGRRAQLTPAMRLHLNRSGTLVEVPPDARLSAASAANAPGQRTPTFYPGVSRLPPQKPFVDIERQPNALERYWPLLLEGRQDPNTGLIIWSLP